MPQTRFVTLKALKLGLAPIVVVNKVDRPGARPGVGRQPDVRALRPDRRDGRATGFSGRLRFRAQRLGDARRQGRQGARDPANADMRPLFETILAHVPAPVGNPDEPLQFQIAALDYSSYVGRLGIGRIRRGRLAAGQEVAVLNGPLAEGQVRPRRGSRRSSPSPAWSACRSSRRRQATSCSSPASTSSAIGTTLAAVETPEALPPIMVDEPTLSMYFQVNTSPLAGREGKYVTSRNCATGSPRRC